MPYDDPHEAPRWSARAKMAFLVFAGIGAFFLISEHRAHVLPYLPWLFLLACPLMHLFHGHGGHGSHHGGEGDSARRPASFSDRTGAPAHDHH